MPPSLACPEHSAKVPSPAFSRCRNSSRARVTSSVSRARRNSASALRMARSSAGWASTVARTSASSSAYLRCSSSSTCRQRSSVWAPPRRSTTRSLSTSAVTRAFCSSAPRRASACASCASSPLSSLRSTPEPAAAVPLEGTRALRAFRSRGSSWAKASKSGCARREASAPSASWAVAARARYSAASARRSAARSREGAAPS
mmetsp:Transcript_94344/g.215853  ORF Transcript_94344/g.215853 Transcript_94344/m.215853 type:complete len:202 (-) Transcript_94344:28-633(-)